MDEDVLNMNDGGAAEFHIHEGFGNDESPLSRKIGDLCHSHLVKCSAFLYALLAIIAKSEKQTDMAARVLSWKQKIEQTLEEQELHPLFDIQEYGERVTSYKRTNV